MTILEHITSISVVAEILRIVYLIGTRFSITFPIGFFVGFTLYDSIYSCFMLFTIFFCKTNYVKCAMIVLFLALLRDLTYKDNYVLCIIDSVICICTLLYYGYKEGKRTTII